MKLAITAAVALLATMTPALAEKGGNTAESQAMKDALKSGINQDAATKSV